LTTRSCIPRLEVSQEKKRKPRMPDLQKSEGLTEKLKTKD